MGMSVPPMLAVKNGSKGGRSLPYLKQLQANVRQHFSWKALALCSSRKNAVAVEQQILTIENILIKGALLYQFRIVKLPPRHMVERKPQCQASDSLLPGIGSGRVEACLDSLMVQTWPNVEVILVNDASTDNSGQICDTYAAQDARIQACNISIMSRGSGECRTPLPPVSDCSQICA